MRYLLSSSLFIFIDKHFYYDSDSIEECELFLMCTSFDPLPIARVFTVENDTCNRFVYTDRII